MSHLRRKQHQKQIDAGEVNTRRRLPWMEETSKEKLQAKLDQCSAALTELDEEIRAWVDEHFPPYKGMQVRLLPLQIVRPGQRQPTSRVERSLRSAENKARLEEVINHPGFVKLQEERQTLRDELDNLKKSWYWLVNFNARRLPSSPNWSDYHPDVQKAVEKVFVGELRVVLELLREGKTMTEVADEVQKPPLEVWRTLKRALNRVSNLSGSLVYQQRWLHPINFDPKEDWETWQPKS